MTHVFESPVGRIRLVAEDGRLRAIDLGADAAPDRADDPVLRAAAEQLLAYFAGERRAFELPLDPGGTPFQRRVWAELAAIPFGETRSYAQVAAAIGRPTATRAVGAANGRNPLAIVVPCHRVIGADGTLTGYAGGLERKRWLLAHEGVQGHATPAQLTLGPLHGNGHSHGGFGGTPP